MFALVRSPVTDPAARAQTPPEGELSVARRWRTLVIGVLAFALPMASQGFTAVVAPDIEASFHLGLGAGMWLFTVYFVVAGAAMLPLARWSDRLGPRRGITLAMGLYAAGEILCLLAPSFALVVVGRAISALSLGATAPLVWGLGSQLFPAGRARRVSFALLTLVIGLGSIGGTLLGAALPATTAPRWGFAVLAVLAVAVGILGRITYPRGRGAPAPYDTAGAALFVLALGLLLLSLKLTTSWGWVALATALVGGCLALAFAGVEVRRSRRGLGLLLPAREFRALGYATGVIGFAALHLVFAGSSTLVPTLLHFTGRYGAGQIALVAALLPLGIAAGAVGRPFVGRLVGNGWSIALAGVIGMGTFGWLMVDPLGSSPWHFGISNVLVGFSFGLALAAYADVALQHVPPRAASAGASMLHTAGNVAVGIGAMVMSLALTSAGPSVLLADHATGDLTATQARQILDAAHLTATPLPEQTELLQAVLALGRRDVTDPDEAQRLREELDAGLADGWRRVAGISLGAMALVTASAWPVRRGGVRESA